MNSLKRLALAAVLIGASVPAMAYVQYPDTSGNSVGTIVPMTLNGAGQAVPTGVTTPSTQSPATVTTGGTFQTALPANPSRTSCLIQNTSAHTAYVYWLATGTPSLTNALQVQAGAVFQCVGPSGAPIRTAIQWTTGTTGDTFVVAENQ